MYIGFFFAQLPGIKQRSEHPVSDQHHPWPQLRCVIHKLPQGYFWNGLKKGSCYLLLPVVLSFFLRSAIGISYKLGTHVPCSCILISILICFFSFTLPQKEQIHGMFRQSVSDPRNRLTYQIFAALSELWGQLQHQSNQPHQIFAHSLRYKCTWVHL